MSQNRLRVYYGPEHESVADHGAVGLKVARQATAKVSVSLGEVLPYLSEALTSDRAWLEDFADDEITISRDLYEVILAFQNYRPSA